MLSVCCAGLQTTVWRGSELGRLHVDSTAGTTAAFWGARLLLSHPASEPRRHEGRSHQRNCELTTCCVLSCSAIPLCLSVFPSHASIESHLTNVVSCSFHPRYSRDVRKSENRFGVGFRRTKPSKNLTSVRTVFRQKLCAVHTSN